MTPDSISGHFGQVLGSLRTLGAPIEAIRSLELIQRELDDSKRHCAILIAAQPVPEKPTPNKNDKPAGKSKGWRSRTDEERAAHSRRMKAHWAKRKKEGKEKRGPRKPAAE